jgi:mannitol operon transcriptional antiterminator
MDMDIVQLAQKHMDFIITTVELQIKELPIILVNPILNETDIKQIQYVLENFLPENKIYGKVIAGQLEDKLNGLKLYSDYVLQLLHNFLFIEQVAADSVTELDHFISRSLAIAGEDRIQIEKDLKNKQEKGSAILKYKGVVLYHLRSKAVDELGMTVIKLKESMEQSKSDWGIGKEDTCIFLSMPLNTDSYAIELLNEVTRKIISSDFAMELKQSSKDEIMLEMNQILDSFIQSKVIENGIK